MQFTGIIKNKARVLSKVVYLDVVTKVDKVTKINGVTKIEGPHKQWVLFKDKHPMHDINKIANASPGSSIIVDGKDNINQQTQLPQVVVNKLINIIPEDGSLSNVTMPDEPKSGQDIMDILLSMPDASSALPDASSVSVVDELLDPLESAFDPLGLKAHKELEDQITKLVGNYALKYSKQNGILLMCRLISGLTVGK